MVKMAPRTAVQGMIEHIGTRVTVPGTPGQGILRYVGEIEGKNGVFCGLELVGSIAALKGKNSGAVDGIQYFEVKQAQSGLFVPMERLKLSNPQLSISRPASRKSSGPGSPNSGTLSPITGRNYNNSPPTSTPTTRSVLKVSRPGSRLGSSEVRPASRASRHSSTNTSNGLPNNNNNSVNTREIENQVKSLSASKITLERELEILKNDHQKSLNEMSEKMTILEELQSTVESLHPLLENYERELSEKEAKILKQRKDFEMAREEWRESLDMLVNTHQEAEDYYESEIDQLTQKLIEAKKEIEESKKTQEIETEEEKEKEEKEHIQNSTIDNDLQLKLDDLTMEKIILEKQLNAKISAQEIEIRKMKETAGNAADLQSFKDDNVELQRKIESSSVVHEKIISDLKQAVLNSQSEHSVEVGALKDTIDAMQERISEQKKQLDEASGLLERIQSVNGDHSDLLKQFEDMKITSTDTIEGLTKRNTELEETSIKFQSTIESLREEILQTKALTSEKMDNVALKLQETIDILKDENKLLQEQLEAAKLEVKQLQQENESHVEKSVLSTNSIEGLKKSIASIEDEKLKLVSETEGLKEEKSKHISTSTSELSKLKSIIQTLQKENDSLRSKIQERETSSDSSIETLKEENSKLLARIETLNEDRENKKKVISEQTNTLHKELQTVKSENSALHEKINKSEETIKQLDAWKITSKSQFDEFQSTIRAKDSFIAELQLQLAQSKNSKNTEESEDILKLRSEINALKSEISDNSNLEKMIEQLKHDLEMRPTFDELSQLQKAIEEIEALHKWETEKQNRELQDVLNSKAEIESQLITTANELKKLKEEIAQNAKDMSMSSTESSISIGLPVYSPKVPTDPSSGKDKWCGLCERDGHDSISCPYENDMF